MDWIKLLLARLATALFWFNPLVWLLAREAHQLREEAADDAVLAADIVDTDYAQLLVGVARHECPGLLLGAHGVAPSQSSLARRVARVLDGESVRGPAPRSFALGVFAGAVLVAAPLAALTLTPAAPKPVKLAAKSPTGEPIAPYYPKTAEPPEAPTDLGHIIATGVSASVNDGRRRGERDRTRSREALLRRLSCRGVQRRHRRQRRRDDRRPGPDGATSTVYPLAARAAANRRSRSERRGRCQLRRARDGQDRHDRAIDRIIEMKAVGVTPNISGRCALPFLASARWSSASSPE